ncbi:hypothetical protein QFZ94_006663 [Paraburkholderia sp. JPY465]
MSILTLYTEFASGTDQTNLRFVRKSLEGSGGLAPLHIAFSVF